MQRLQDSVPQSQRKKRVQTCSQAPNNCWPLPSGRRVLESPAMVTMRGRKHGRQDTQIFQAASGSSFFRSWGLPKFQSVNKLTNVMRDAKAAVATGRQLPGHRWCSTWTPPEVTLGLTACRPSTYYGSQRVRMHVHACMCGCMHVDI